jgi:hypothetical protein
MFRGSVLTAAHLIAVILLAISWRYFWTKGDAAAGDTA